MKIIITSYDEEWEENFCNRAGEELTKALQSYIARGDVNLCNDTVVIVCEVLEKTNE